MGRQEAGGESRNSVTGVLKCWGELLGLQLEGCGEWDAGASWSQVYPLDALVGTGKTSQRASEVEAEVVAGPSGRRGAGVANLGGAWGEGGLD